jgi:hypothetical protein
MSRTSSGPEWAGDMLDRPEMMAAFTGQLRRSLSDQAEWLARIRRDAEAMWKANPPPEYGSFEAWWRHRWVTGPFGEIQELLEKASTLTFQLEARYRRGHHEIPAARQAAAQAKQAPELARSAPAAHGDQSRAGAPRAATSPDGSFMDMIRGERSA